MSSRSEIRVVGEATELLRRELSTLRPDQWEAPAACGVWSVAEVVAHLAWAANLYGVVIERALAGITQPPHDSGAIADYATRAVWFADRVRAFRAELGDRLLDAYVASGRALVERFERLRPEDWQRQAPHPSGRRSIRDVLRLRIVELSVHRFDILDRLGLESSLPDGTHETIVDWLPIRIRGSFVRHEPLPEPLRYRFVLTPPLQRAVRLTIRGDAVEIEADDEPGADVVLTTDPQTCILLFSGRLQWREALDSGIVDVKGRRELAGELAGWFQPG